MIHKGQIQNPQNVSAAGLSIEVLWFTFGLWPSDGKQESWA